MENLETFYNRYLRYFLAKDDLTATAYDKYMALSYAIRSNMVDKWIDTQKAYHETNARRVYYLSMEYVLGKSLRQNMTNLGLDEAVEAVSRNLGFSLDQVFDQEDDFELGNGGKGRLAACFQDSMATLGLPAMAYGLRYDYAMFRQKIHEGLQTEAPFDWLHKGHPWEIVRPEYACQVGFHGNTSAARGPGDSRRLWKPADIATAVPYDMPIPGFQNDTVNTLRLWSARPSEEFLSDYINHGDYVRACEEKSQSGRISKILFPDEDVRRATELRIKQQYFFVAASLADILRRYKMHNPDIRGFDAKVAIQLNGSRCALAIPELMRLLLDDEGLNWDDAWRITSRVFAYTSHAVSRENLENWPVYLMEQIVPRNMQIIFEINQRFLDTIRPAIGSDELIRDLSIVEEGEVKRVKMAHLAVLGAHTINGVSLVQSSLLKTKVFAPLSDHCGATFLNVTNGIAHRRWVASTNRPLAELITEAIGEQWQRDAERLRDLERFAGDAAFLERLGAVKRAAKTRLAAALERCCNERVDPESLFDVQCKKIHPYKRQTLNLFATLDRYLALLNGEADFGPRTHLFAGKAAPSDHLAKQIIHLINVLAEVINGDARVKDRLRIVFVPDYGISWAEYLIPAADLSEQIATPALEASGTSNMKLALNGALTIASKSGSNVEMIERIGEENLFVFGASENKRASYQEIERIIANEPRLSAIYEFLERLLPTVADGGAIYPLLASLRDSDEFRVLRDFGDYADKQRQVDRLYAQQTTWREMCLKNIARIGWFSSDRAVREYEAKIWRSAEA
jgi:starch phosphorylase